MRVTIEEAAKRLGLPQQTLRVWIANKTCPFGDVVIDKQGRNGKRTYYISSERLERYLRGENINERRDEIVSMDGVHSLGLLDNP